MVLSAVSDLRNINRLAPGQTLRFTTDGITVVYGDNGSGKSGYARVLKKVCRVRSEAAEEIRPDVYSADRLGPAEATIRFQVEGEEPTHVRWRAGQPSPECLSRISVFDSRAAQIYADKDNRLEFLPHSLDVLPRLGDACKLLGGRLDTDTAALQKSLGVPVMVAPAGTKVSALLQRLDVGAPAARLPTEEEIRDLAAWGEAEEGERVALAEALRGDPAAAAARCRRLQGTLEELAHDVERYDELLGDEPVVAARRAWEDAQAAREAAILAAAEAFGNEPLREVGSEAWRLMFSYAKEYSALAYPGEPFPPAGPDKLCPLCQQPLAPEATERLARFQRYVEDKAEAEAERLEKARDTVSSQIATLRVRLANDAKSLLGDLRELDPGGKDLVEVLEAALGAFSDRQKQTSAALGGAGEFADILQLPPSPAPRLRASATRLVERAQQYEKPEDLAQRKRLAARRDELEGRRKLSENLSAVLERRSALREFHMLKACRQACDSRDISNKSTELRRKYITPEFKARLAEELAALDLEHLPIKVEDRSAVGAGVIGVGLASTAPSKNREILSEGEFRALALACFLAEVKGIPGHNGIILDDPVSSLDHLRAGLVAKRLVRVSAAAESDGNLK